MKRAIIIVMDSVGMGELPDAEKYGDRGSNTLGNIAAAIKDFGLPNLEELGLGNIESMKGYKRVQSPKGAYGRMSEQSAGKDTTTGHWELSGITLKKPFPVYPNGFPQEIINSFENAIGTKTLGNYAASGTEIIKQLGGQHVKTGYPIVYTSADSVFQIAAHEDIVSVDRLYEMCRIAREILKNEHAVGRVIARPFTGAEGDFKRTSRRHDFSLKPIEKTVLDFTVEKGYKVKAVGKIEDIFSKQGITDAVHTQNNMDGVEKTLEYMGEDFEGILFTNLVDFDMAYGHRNDVNGYANALKEFDARVPEILSALKDDDVLFITADHGCDPTTPSTDHSREYVPLLVYGKKVKHDTNLGTRSTFADLAATIAEFLGTQAPSSGISFYKDITV
ncbi:MAG: phosphopentomutase [Clostridia bacterium]|nr:phosphopentomutase [Clostridia bacterium]